MVKRSWGSHDRQWTKHQIEGGKKISFNAPEFFTELSRASEPYLSHRLHAHVNTSVPSLDPGKAQRRSLWKSEGFGVSRMQVVV